MILISCIGAGTPPVLVRAGAPPICVCPLPVCIGEGREGLEGAENEQWEADMEALARDRLGEYASCVEGWESKVEEWRKRFDKAA